MLRKTAFLVTGTIAGVVGVLSYNPPQLDAAIAPTGSTPTPDTSPSESVVASENSPAQPTTTNSAKPSTKKTSTAKTANTNTNTNPEPAPVVTQSAGISGTFKGDTSQTRWGPVQVQITLTDGKITDVTTLQYPNGDRKSLNISNRVIPWLQEETLQVQSANISGISGATYTYFGFRDSLASALQKAGL